jgi:transglutaminase-like putative cysteine protease
VKSKQDSFPTIESDQLFKATGQELVREEGPRARILRVRRGAPKGAKERPIQPTAELEESLKPNPYIQSDDKKIVETAQKELSGISDAWESACHLEKWVHDNIRTKGLETAFATASEVMETREGDCTEHGVLLAALLRAAGLPSKVAAGLIYHDGAFVGHMWTEVYIGEWVPLDATLGECFVGAEHIALTTTSLDTSTILDFFCGMVSFFGNVEIEVLEIRE